MTPDLTLSAVKLTPRHLERQAVIYIRQSSPKQVREHLDSQLTQRALVGRAQSLGWHPERIAVFDGDLGQSATGIESAKFRGDPLQQWALRPTLCAWNNTKHTRTSINCASSCGASVRSSGVDS